MTLTIITSALNHDDEDDDDDDDNHLSTTLIHCACAFHFTSHMITIDTTMSYLLFIIHSIIHKHKHTHTADQMR